MKRLEVGNEKIKLRLAIGPSGEKDPRLQWRDGIFVESIRDLAVGREHEYLTSQTYLFEFAVNNGPSQISSRDLVVTNHAILAPGRFVRIYAKTRDDSLSFKLDVYTDGSNPAVILALTVTNTSRQLGSAFLRMVVPKLLGLQARGGPCDTYGMVSMEIGSNVELAGTLTRNGKQDDFGGTFAPGTIGMPYRKEAQRIGLPTSMNTMEVASFYSAHGGGMFVADIDHDVEAGIAPIQLTLSLLGVEGFWVSELKPEDPVKLPNLAIGVHPDGDWHAAVDYYLDKHRQRPNWRFPPQPAWFADQAAIYTHSGGGAGGMYLSNMRENLPDGAIGTFFEAAGEWLPVGPVPISGAARAPAGAPLAVVVRDEKDEDLFVVDKEGAIGWTPMRNNGPWGLTEQITPPGIAQVGGWLAAVARHRQQVDVFFIGMDGALWTVYGPATGKPSWILTQLSRAIALPGAPLAAITRGGKDVDVFLVDAVGAVRWTFERDNGKWLPTPRTITINETCVSPSCLVALVRNPVQTDVFFVDKHGKMATLYKTTPSDDGPWQIAQLSEQPLAPAGAGIAAIVRNGKDEDIFVIADRGAIQHSAMRNNGGWSIPSDLDVVDAQGVPQHEDFAPPGAPITALAVTADRTDLFFVDGNGALVRLYRTGADPWRRMDPTPALYTAPKAATAAVIRSARQLDVFLVMKGRLRSFLELPKLLEEARSLGTDIVYLWDYWEGRPRLDADVTGGAYPPGPSPAPLHPPYFNKGDYWPRSDLGGESALKEGIASVHALGGKVILYVEPFIIFRDSQVARTRPKPGFKTQGEYLAGRFPTHESRPLDLIASPEEQGVEWQVYWPYYYTMVPAFADWQNHVIKVVDRLVNNYGADGIFLDSFGWQLNWPMHVTTLKDNIQYWPIEYAQGVLTLAKAVMDTIRPDRVVLVETPGGPIRRHCHGGLSLDFDPFHVDNGLSDQTRITASAVRYGIPEVRYFSNGGDSMNRLHQIYAAGHGLALCHQHILEDAGAHIAHIRQLVDIRRTHADTLIRGHQSYQPTTEDGRDDVAAYCYRGTDGTAIITVVNTSEVADYAGRLQLRPEHAGSSWTDLLTGRLFVANGTTLPITVPRGGRSTTTNLLVLHAR
ncbi:hypothetical protein [Kitasatospora sp. NPDC097643]|uniref:hypothetical protein n=1 Tax=Kitasatospora sp. NPDC097643 TaxID=3157230 RepID=UPI00332B5280